METRKEEMFFRKHCFLNEKSNIKKITIRKYAIEVEFIKPCGHAMSVECEYLAAPCSQHSFEIPFVRKLTDIEIENERYLEIEEWHKNSEEQMEQDLEEEAWEYYMNEEY